jgi:hypothetical protein
VEINSVWEAYHTLLYTESSVRKHESLNSPAAPGSVQKAAMLDPRRVATGRLAGCKKSCPGSPR